MSILITVAIGLIVGALARLAIPGKEPGTVVITILLGIAGSLIAGLLGHSLGWYAPAQTPGILASVLGAILILFTYRLVVGLRAVW